MNLMKFCVSNAWKKKQGGAASCGCIMLYFSITVQHASTVALFTLVNNFFFFEKPVQLIDFTRTVHVNVNNNFVFVFF